MDAYPLPYVEHNLPFVVLSGLGSDTLINSTYEPHPLLKERGIEIDSAVPVVSGERAQQLRQEFLNADGKDAPWNSLPRNRGEVKGFRVKAVGRGYVLPPRKAQPPQISPDETPPGTPHLGNGHKWVLHSPISPLSPGSPTFPDGVMTPLWIAKHQYHIPAVFISFFTLTSEDGRDSLNDNQLKAEINRIKSLFLNSGYKTHYAVVILSDKSIFESPEIEDRLANIRRTTGLDPRHSLFFLPASSSRAELASFVHQVLTTVQPICVEHYRDLSKHARRKKNRSNIPPPTAPPTRGPIHTLAAPGWNVRYDFKLGIFAEFRQEMDAACRHYSLAIDGLLDGDGVFETTASWSPRWDETRLLADSIAIRIVRCLMWNNGPTSAVQSWQNYKDRMRDLIDRRGKGSANYGWQAWESRWAVIMAEIIQRVQPPIFQVVDTTNNSNGLPERYPLFSPAEKTFPIGERLAPWHLVHHPGYWYKIAAERAVARRLLAEEMPEEDRTPPGMSPATKVANRYGTYDTYLVPEPHVEFPHPEHGGQGYDHAADVVDLFNKAISEFHTRGQQRLCDKLQLAVGKELMHANRHSEAMGSLKPLWEGMCWRDERWWSLVSEVTWALNACAKHCGEEEIFLSTEWELHSRLLRTNPKKVYEFNNCLDSFAKKEGEDAPKVTVDAGKVMSCLSTTVAFAAGEGHVAEPLYTQVAVRSNAQRGSMPITVSSIRIDFTGPLGRIELQHEEKPEGASPATEVSLTEVIRSGTAPSFKGCADLTFPAGAVRVFNFPITLKEDGEVNVQQTCFEIQTDRFALQSILEGQPDAPSLWWYMSRGGLKSKRLSRNPDDPVLRVLPKPPKMEVQLVNLQKQYYTNENVVLDLQIKNDEDEDTEASLEVQLLNHTKEYLDFDWVETEQEETSAAGKSIGKMAPGSKQTKSLSFVAPPDSQKYSLEVKVVYHVLSDPDVPISKIMAGELVFIDPFEATYDFAPQVHPEPWPSFFRVDDAQKPEPPKATPTQAFGLPSRYLLKARIGSYAEEDLVIDDADLIVHSVHGGAVCTVTKVSTADPDPEGAVISPQAVHLRSFVVDVRKVSLEDRRSSALESSISVTWRRKRPLSAAVAGDAKDKPITSTIAHPRLVASNAEPRVLASARPSHATLSAVAHTTTTTSSADKDKPADAEADSSSPPAVPPKTPEKAPSAPVPQLIHVTFHLENPTMHFLTFDITMDASDDFAFSGPKLTALHVLPLSRHAVRYNVLPLVSGKWIEVRCRVQDRYFNKVLRVLPTEGLRSVGGEKGKEGGGVAVWADVLEGE
ncbi:Gryzun, putative trafficking through golgi-domain-containing protein [Phyllosticta capitalensis]